MLGDLLKKTFSSNKKNNPFYEKSNTEEIQIKEQKIHADIEYSMSIFKKIYSFPDNKDVKFRTFQIGGLNKQACLISISTITDIKLLDEYAIQPLLNNDNPSCSIENLLAVQALSTVDCNKDAIYEINKGNAVLLIDDYTKAYSITAANFQGRDVSNADNEIVLKGPKEAFTEKAASNISLIRKRIRDENLIVESAVLSKRTNNELFIVYIKDLANEQLLDNIKNRVNSLNVDSVQNLALLEQHIEERKLSLFPSILYTERPDRASAFLEDGYIVLLMDNSPDSLVLPATFWSFFHISEDHYLILF
ncbi:spore germination protein [Cytobacillus solani]|uniref:spore germination protein n=1 Tax=Cytobacillus solani TaxID=1637975 RepID=UPI0006F8E7A9|nr:spore germination protein [Cytobacillus solani]